MADRIVVMTSRPGEVKAELKVNLPRPRSPEMMADAAFVDLSANAWRWCARRRSRSWARCRRRWPSCAALAEIRRFRRDGCGSGPAAPASTTATSSTARTCATRPPAPRATWRRSRAPTALRCRCPTSRRRTPSARWTRRLLSRCVGGGGRRLRGGERVSGLVIADRPYRDDQQVPCRSRSRTAVRTCAPPCATAARIQGSAGRDARSSINSSASQLTAMGGQGCGQPSHSHTPRPITHARSSPFSHGRLSVKRWMHS